MSTFQIYLWLASVSFLWSFGSIFAFVTNDPEYKAEKFPLWQHYIGSIVCALVASFFLGMGAYFIWLATERARYGWVMRV